MDSLQDLRLKRADTLSNFMKSPMGQELESVLVSEIDLYINRLLLAESEWEAAKLTGGLDFARRLLQTLYGRLPRLGEKIRREHKRQLEMDKAIQGARASQREFRARRDAIG